MKKSTTKSEFVSASQTYRAVWLKTRYDYDYVYALGEVHTATLY